MMYLFFKIQGEKPAFSFSNGHGRQIYVYLLNECECCITETSHDFVLVYDAYALPEDEPWHEDHIRIDRVSVNDRLHIVGRNYDPTWHHNFWVKCNEFFAEKYLLGEE